MSPLYQKAQHWTQHSNCVSPGLSRGEGSPPGMLFDLLWCRGMLLVHYQLLVHQDPRSFSAKQFSSYSVPATCYPEFSPPKVQDLAFPFAELHEIPVDPFLHPIKVHLGSSRTVWSVNHSYQIFICNAFCWRNGCAICINHRGTFLHRASHKLL